MKILSKIWNGFLDILGIRRNSKYVKNYLNEANMRSAVFMSAVVFVLEAWLILRQTHKYIVPSVAALETVTFQAVFRIIFQNTSNFILLLFFGVAMFVYSLQYLSSKKSLSKMIIAIVFGGLSLAVCCLLPLEFQYGSIILDATKTTQPKVIYGIFKVIFYISVFLFDVGIIFASIYRYKGGKRASLSSVMVISLFAFVCLMFGVMVSYGDFISTRVFYDAAGNKVTMNDAQHSFAYEHKQIICFLMFTIYIGCLLIWNPLISIGVLGTLFLGFYLAISNVVNLGGRRFPEGDEVNYLTFFISLTMVCISIYNQRISEAKKDEELEELATKDTLTGLLSFEYFTLKVKETIAKYNIQRGDSVYLFINITNFKVYNDQKGFEKGNEFLKTVGQIINETFKELALVSRQSDDHFVVFSANQNIEEKIKEIARRVESQDADVKPSIKVGAAAVYNPDEDPHYAVEKARYAHAELKRMPSNKLILWYDDKMHDNYLMVQYIVTHIDEAIKNGYIKAFYQPVVWSKGRTLCGVEALARWIDPKYGFLSPAKFVPALESAQLVYKLDKEILRIVCADIRHNLDNGLPALPVSINFSRADFGLIDIVDVVSSTVEQYKIPHELLHVEITESALTNETDTLKNTINRLHEKGFTIWLDDFGSGYSSFNVLKDYDFDVLKLDMAFLIGFNGNEKAKALIKSVISLAEQIGMKTLCEGVETAEQAAFLEEASCGRLQGYLYGKPLSYEELMKKIDEGEYNLAKKMID
ncbi:MAG: EAL domain-containing protein [Bacilli bacterium]|nr:EAL domain-containing protein [Bacilli bacterium]